MLSERAMTATNWLASSLGVPKRVPRSYRSLESVPEGF
jgi:hypothetical protein